MNKEIRKVNPRDISVRVVIQLETLRAFTGPYLARVNTV
jgi:hypothetical protein